ncbi:MAG: TIGR02206 family membrane protein [Fidelibacterota bacterium]|nr:MAG: TIGR02206 family membrane protein [Candidatus Neomarinimicrobiota bacterium]
MDTFELFGTHHLRALLVVAVVWTAVLVYGGRWASARQQEQLARALAIILVVQEFALHGYHLAAGTWDHRDILPLHLCGFSVFLVAYTLVTRKPRLFEVVYFWGIGGAINPLLTPDITVTFPHFLFFQFFTSHGLIILGVLYLIVTTELRPSFKGLHWVFGLTAAAALVVGGINWLIGSNYMFLCEKPYGTNLTSFMADWPWYIGQIGVIALVLYYLLYLPYALADWRRARQAPAAVSAGE